MFNKIITENFPNLRKRGSSRYGRLAKYQTGKIRKKHP
jgi:hypothetical protein